MNRTHIASAANPNSAAPIPATASMVSGAVKRVPTRAPTHNPAYEAPQASSGGVAAPASDDSPRAARVALTMPPVQARKVPSIHQIGRYHQVLPPPMASQVQGYALNGRSNTMSSAVSTPTWVPPTITVRKSERSDAVAVAVADMFPQVCEAE